MIAMESDMQISPSKTVGREEGRSGRKHVNPTANPVVNRRAESSRSAHDERRKHEECGQSELGSEKDK